MIGETARAWRTWGVTGVLPVVLLALTIYYQIQPSQSTHTKTKDVIVNYTSRSEQAPGRDFYPCDKCEKKIIVGFFKTFFVQ